MSLELELNLTRSAPHKMLGGQDRAKRATSQATTVSAALLLYQGRELISRGHDVHRCIVASFVLRLRPRRP